jgi:gluconate 2-dehydrogenase alpha chain
MQTELPPVDVVCVGVGWTGGILARELAQNGKTVVGLERGGPRTTEDFWMVHDELRYSLRYDMMQQLRRETVTFRNTPDQLALPMRRYGSFLPGTGLGGAGVHWNGVVWRFLPYDFEIRSHTTDRYGAGKIPGDMPLQDWGITYAELEPYFTTFDRVAGIGGKAGNLQGAIQEGGNPFEGPRSEEYPLPPMMESPVLTKFKDACLALDFNPFPQPSANHSEAYTNADGMQLGACQYCGYCERYGCEWNAKSSPITTVVPAALETGNFELRTQCEVTGLVVQDNRVTGVRYVDPITSEEFIQPAEVVALTSYVFNNVRFLLTAGIGTPYDPATGQGVVGKNYCYQNLQGGATGFFDDEQFNLYMGAGALGYVIDNFNGDNFDHRDLDFLHGGSISISQTGTRPIASNPVPSGTASWGREFKEKSLFYYLRTLNVSCQGSVLPHRENFLDLDPTYSDAFGNPLLRMTFDWKDNDRALARFEGEVCERIMQEMNPTIVDARKEITSSYNIVPYQSTHNTGGAIMGSDPGTSVVNNFLQCWDAENLFVVGASAFAHNSGYNPTGTVGALAFRAADGIKQYLESPGPLA